MSFLTNFVGILAPVVHSFETLRNPTRPSLIECLHFWAIYGTFLIANWVMNTFYISCFIPCYDFFCCIFVILVAIPELKLASTIYTKYLEPFLIKYEQQIKSSTQSTMSHFWQHAVPDVAVTFSSLMQSLSELFTDAAISVQRFAVEVQDDDDVIIEQVRNVNASRNSTSRSISNGSGMRTPTHRVNFFDAGDEVLGNDDDDDEVQNEVKREILEDEDAYYSANNNSFRQQPRRNFMGRKRREW